jgi:hypothetical protein
MKTISGALGIDPQPKRLSQGVYRNPDGSLGHSSQLPKQQAIPRPVSGQMPQPNFAPGIGQFEQNQMPMPPQGQGWQKDPGFGGGWSNPGMLVQQQQQMAQDPRYGQQLQGGFGQQQQNQMLGGFGQQQMPQPYGIPRSPMPQQSQGSQMVNNMTQQQRNPNYLQGR